VQFQNIDRLFKRLFVQRSKDYYIGEADAPQLEFRTAGFLGQDPQAIADIEAHADVHRFTASVLNKKPEAKVTKNERTLAKPYTFKPLYGGSSGTPDEKRYYEAFKKKYKAINNVQRGWTNHVLRTKNLELASGLVFYWPDCKIDPRSGYIHHTTEIFNYPVQSLATAEIIPISLVYLWFRLRGHKSFIINTVHDSMVCEVHKDEVGLWQDAVRHAFTGDVYTYLRKIYGIEFNVTLGVSYHHGEYWGDGEEELYEEKNNGSDECGESTPVVQTSARPTKHLPA
jgi:DNA polymerase I-like protein with 3'-5' exonuclease and polymerase domains